MRIFTSTVIALLLGALIALPAGATVPELLPVQGMLADLDGNPIDGATDLTFKLFDAETAGVELWFTSRTGYDVDNGFFSVYLGENKALDVPALLGAGELWLEITVGVDVLDRVRLASVLFALEAGTCNQLGDLGEGDVQPILSGTCSAGEYVNAINPGTGVISCDTPSVSGDYLPLNYGNVATTVTGTGGLQFTDNVGIGGASNASYQVHVPTTDTYGMYVNNTNAAASLTYGIYSRASGAGGTSHYGVYGYASGADTTNIGIYGQGSGGTNAVGVYAKGKMAVTDVSGSGTVDLCQDTGNSQVATCASSKRFKKDIADLDMGLETVMSLRPVSYNWKNDGTKDIGFVAEEAAEVSPLLVNYNVSGDVHGVRYRQYTAVLTNAIKQQQKQIAELKKLVCKDNPSASACK